MAMTLITTNTSSNAASSSFTSSIDSTYKLYIFKFYDVNPVTDSAEFTVDFSTDGGSNYGMTKTSSYFYTDHWEDDSYANLGYVAANDLAQGTAVQKITRSMGNGGDESGVGTLWLFNPSNTTYVKHFYCTSVIYEARNAVDTGYSAGYINSTSDVDAVQFAMTSGNMDAVIKLYGVG